MTTRYMTAEEYAALSDEALYVMKMSGDEVVIVDDPANAAAPSEPSAQDHVPDVSFSFTPTSGKQATPVSAVPEQPAPPAAAPTPPPAAAQPTASGDMQMALLQKMVTLQQQTLSEIAALRTELTQIAVRIDGPAPVAEEDGDAVEQLQQMMQALDAEIAKQTGGDGST
ncbi:MAG: hypothetical protein AAFN94_03295 [Pseudomonadota bacterium]